MILNDFDIDVGSITMYEDNQSTIKMAHMAVGNSRVKHLKIKQSFVKEKIDKMIIDIKIHKFQLSSFRYFN